MMTISKKIKSFLSFCFNEVSLGSKFTIIFLISFILASVSTASAVCLSDYCQDYGQSGNEYITVPQGNYQFEVDGIGLNKWTEWFDGEIGSPIKKNEYSGSFRVDPSFEYTFNSGTTLIRAEIYDDNGKWEEAHRWYVTVDKPDLVVDNISISPSSPQAGEKITITATLKNQGNIDADPFYLEYYIDGSYIGEDICSLGLDAKDSDKETITHTVTNSGNHILTVIVDSKNDIDEIDENNNTESVSILVLDINKPPTIPGTISASNITTTSARVTWEDSNDPDDDTITYYVEYKKDLHLIWTSAGSTTNNYLDIGGLDPATTYDVRIRAYDGDLYSDWRDQENVITTIPINRVPSVPGSINVPVVTTTSAQVSWDASNDPDDDEITYEIEYGKNNWPGWTAVPSTSATSTLITGLEPDTTYVVRVRARDNRGGISNWNEKDPAFTTLDNLNTQPSISKITPTSSTVTIQVNQIQEFKVRGTDIDGNIDFVKIQTNGQITETQSCSSCSELIASTTYVWNSAGKFTVTASVFDTDGLNSSTTWSVTVLNILKPETPKNPSPGNNQYLSSSPNKLEWNLCENATSYDVYLDNTKIASNENSPRVMLSNNLDIGMHTWQVVAKGPGGNTYGPLWTFTIEPPPDVDPPPDGDNNNLPDNTDVIEDSDAIFDSNVNGSQYSEDVQDPVNVALGNYNYKHTDIIAPAPVNNLTFSRFYDTLIATENQGIGFGWSHNWVGKVIELGDGKVIVNYESGTIEHYETSTIENGIQNYTPVLKQNKNTLSGLNNGTYILKTKSRDAYYFENVSGEGYEHQSVLTKKVNRQGLITILNYDSNGLSSIEHNNQPPIFLISYNESGLISKVQGPEGQEYRYYYDENSNLIEVVNSTLKSSKFSYDANHLMLTATDENGTTYLTNEYDNENRVIKQIDGLGNIAEFSYDSSTYTTTVSNRLGLLDIYEHDQNYRLIKHTNPLGYITTYSYDEHGNLIGEKDANGNVTLYEYDDSGNQIKMITPFGYATSYTYDSDDNLLSITAPDGGITKHTYDSNGNILTTTDPLGNVTKFEYTSEGLLTASIDALGNVTSFEYDSIGNRIKGVDPLGSTTKWTYDGIGRVVSKTDPLENKTYFEYDKANQLIKTINPENEIKEWTYTQTGKVKSETDQTGQTISYEYDDNDRLVKVTHLGSGRITTMEYDNEDQLISTTKPGNRTTIQVYDDAGRIIAVRDDLNNETKYEYDANSNIVAEIDPLNNRTEYNYDKLNRKISKTDPLGNHTYFYYDFVGNLVKVIDAEGRVKQNEYNISGKLISSLDGLGNKTTYEYGKAGNLIKQTDALGQVTLFEYNEKNLLVKTIDALGGVSSQNYDAAGRKISQTDPNGNTTYFEFNANGKVVSEIDASGNKVSYNYDARGLLSEVINGRGQTIEYEYTPDGLLDKERLPEGEIVHSYNLSGDRVQTSSPEGLIRSEFDSLGRVISRTDVFGHKISYEYDEAGNLVLVVYPDGERVTYEYNENKKLASVTDWYDRVTYYSYDRAGVLISISRPDGSKQILDYDEAVRLTGLTDYNKSGDEICSYEYELNQIGKKVGIKAYEPLPPVLPEATIEFDYGVDNRLVSANGLAQEFDSDGNLVLGLLGGSAKTFQYDSRNKLLNGAGVTYQYDGDGLRISFENNNVTTNFVVNPNAVRSQILEERDSAGNLIARYVYGIGLISQESQDGANYRLYHFDSRGSTVALTDINGEITDRYTYDPFGKLMGSEGNSRNPFKYNGRDGVYTDPNGLYFMRSRYYNPETLRFLERDILLGSIIDGQSTNRYAYVVGDPISLIDPSGFSGEKDSSGWLEGVHYALDGFGMVPALGIIPDLLNGGIYALQGDWVNMGFALGAAVPGAGQGVTVAKYVNKGRKVYKAAKAGKKGKNSLRVVAGDTNRAVKIHKHHTIPKEIQKKLPERLKKHKDIIGRKGLPNRRPVEAGRHLNEIHKGPGGGAYNQRFEEEIMKRGGYDMVRVKDVLEIRDNLVKEFDIP